MYTPITFIQNAKETDLVSALKKDFRETKVGLLLAPLVAMGCTQVPVQVKKIVPTIDYCKPAERIIGRKYDGHNSIKVLYNKAGLNTDFEKCASYHFGSMTKTNRNEQSVASIHLTEYGTALDVTVVREKEGEKSTFACSPVEKSEWICSRVINNGSAVSVYSNNRIFNKDLFATPISEDEEVCEKSLKEESKAEQVAKEGWNFVINFAKKIRLKQQSKIF